MKYNLRSLEGANHSLLPDSSLGKNVEHTDASKKRGIEGGGINGDESQTITSMTCESSNIFFVFSLLLQFLMLLCVCGDHSEAGWYAI